MLRNERDGGGDHAERLLGIAVVDRRDMVGQRRQRSRMLRPDRRPIGAEMKLLVGMAEAVEEMRGLERRRSNRASRLRRRFSAPGSPLSCKRRGR